MTERHPIYSGLATGQPIGYIEDDQAFDLFDRPCATYEGNTGLLRHPKNNAVVGYVSLSYIFVGSSWMAQELFSKTGPITQQPSLEELEDEDSDAAVCGADDGNAENVDTVQLIAQAPAVAPPSKSRPIRGVRSDAFENGGRGGARAACDRHHNFRKLVRTG